METFKSEGKHTQLLRSHTQGQCLGLTRKLLLLEFWGISVSWTVGIFTEKWSILTLTWVCHKQLLV